LDRAECMTLTAKNDRQTEAVVVSSSAPKN